MPPTRLFFVNVVLLLVIGGLVTAHWRELRWACTTLRQYWGGTIGPPAERQLYLDAREMIREQRELDEARRLLDESLRIDPTSPALYWKGRYHAARGEDDLAILDFRAYLALDPTEVAVYTRAAAAHERNGELAVARRLLAAGKRYFEARVDLYEPRDLDGAPVEARRKAEAWYRDYRSSIVRLDREIARLDEAGGPGTRSSP